MESGFTLGTSYEIRLGLNKMNDMGSLLWSSEGYRDEPLDIFSLVWEDWLALGYSDGDPLNDLNTKILIIWSM